VLAEILLVDLAIANLLPEAFIDGIIFPVKFIKRNLVFIPDFLTIENVFKGGKSVTAVVPEGIV